MLYKCSLLARVWSGGGREDGSRLLPCDLLWSLVSPGRQASYPHSFKNLWSHPYPLDIWGLLQRKGLFKFFLSFLKFLCSFYFLPSEKYWQVPYDPISVCARMCTCVDAHTKAKGQHWMSSSLTFHLVFWDTMSCCSGGSPIQVR